MPSMSHAFRPASAIALVMASHAIESVVRLLGRICGVSPTPTMQYLSVRAPIVLLNPSSGARPDARNFCNQPVDERCVHLARFFLRDPVARADDFLAQVAAILAHRLAEA